MTAFDPRETLAFQPSVQFRVGDGGSGFLFDSASGAGFVVNMSGGRLAQGLIQGRSTDQLAQDLVDDFDVELSEALADVADFIKALQDNSIGVCARE